jgi:hypothetical protein
MSSPLTIEVTARAFAATVGFGSKTAPTTLLHSSKH